MADRKRVRKALEKVRVLGRVPTPELERRLYALSEEQITTFIRRAQGEINKMRRGPGLPEVTREDDPLREGVLRAIRVDYSDSSPF